MKDGKAISVSIRPSTSPGGRGKDGLSSSGIDATLETSRGVTASRCSTSHSPAASIESKRRFILDELERRMRFARKECADVSADVYDLEKEIAQTKKRIDVQKKRMREIPNETTSGTFRSKMNQRRFLRRYETLQRRNLVAREWRDMAVGETVDRKREIDDLRQNKMCHLKSFEDSNIAMKELSDRVREYEIVLEELKQEEEAKRVQERFVFGTFLETKDELEARSESMDKKIAVVSAEVTKLKMETEDLEDGISGGRAMTKRGKMSRSMRLRMEFFRSGIRRGESANGGVDDILPPIADVWKRAAQRVGQLSLKDFVGAFRTFLAEKKAKLRLAEKLSDTLKSLNRETERIEGKCASALKSATAKRKKMSREHVRATKEKKASIEELEKREKDATAESKKMSDVVRSIAVPMVEARDLLDRAFKDFNIAADEVRQNIIDEDNTSKIVDPRDAPFSSLSTDGVSSKEVLRHLELLRSQASRWWQYYATKMNVGVEMGVDERVLAAAAAAVLKTSEGETESEEDYAKRRLGEFKAKGAEAKTKGEEVPVE